MRLQFLTELEGRKKKRKLLAGKKKTKNSNERLKGTKKKKKKKKINKKRGEIKRIAPQWIKQRLCKNKQHKEKEQNNI